MINKKAHYIYIYVCVCMCVCVTNIKVKTIIILILNQLWYIYSPWYNISIVTSSREMSTNTAVKIEDDLIISESCIKRLKEIASDGTCLRVTVEGGGCSGFQYKFDLDPNIQKDDKYVLQISNV